MKPKSGGRRRCPQTDEEPPRRTTRPPERRRQFFLEHRFNEPRIRSRTPISIGLNHAVPSNKLVSGDPVLFFSMAKAAKVPFA